MIHESFIVAAVRGCVEAEGWIVSCAPGRDGAELRVDAKGEGGD